MVEIFDISSGGCHDAVLLHRGPVELTMHNYCVQDGSILLQNTV